MNQSGFHEMSFTGFVDISQLVSSLYLSPRSMGLHASFKNRFTSEIGSIKKIWFEKINDSPTMLLWGNTVYNNVSYGNDSGILCFC